MKYVSKECEVFLMKESAPNEVPILRTMVAAGATGFPSPADDYLESSLDLNEYLKVNKEATFYVKVIGQSMKGVGIDEGDILVVDRSLKAVDSSIVVCLLNGELLVKKLSIQFQEVRLVSAHPDYSDIVLKDGNSLLIWGVVKSVVKDFVKPKVKSYVRTSRRK